MTFLGQRKAGFPHLARQEGYWLSWRKGQGVQFLFRLSRRQMVVPRAFFLLKAHCRDLGIAFDADDYADYGDSLERADEIDLEIVALMRGAFREPRRFHIDGKTDTATRTRKDNLLQKLRFSWKHGVPLDL
ncbi:MAG: hypothetical protein AAGH70_00440 [Pseudomonadota bacterium]